MRVCVPCRSSAGFPAVRSCDAARQVPTAVPSLPPTERPSEMPTRTPTVGPSRAESAPAAVRRPVPLWDLPHLRRDRACPFHICAGTGLTPPAAQRLWEPKASTGPCGPVRRLSYTCPAGAGRACKHAHTHARTHTHPRTHTLSHKQRRARTRTHALTWSYLRCHRSHDPPTHPCWRMDAARRWLIARSAIRRRCRFAARCRRRPPARMRRARPSSRQAGGRTS
jgi:hypothetical protein